MGHALEVLQACARQVLQEMETEGTALGLEVVVEVRPRPYRDSRARGPLRSPASQCIPKQEKAVTVELCCPRSDTFGPELSALPLPPDIPMQGRVKSLYSTYKKMVRKGVPLEQVLDARALRLIVDDMEGRWGSFGGQAPWNGFMRICLCR